MKEEFKKWLSRAKVVFLLILFMCNSLEGFADSSRLSLTVKDVTLSELFKEIEQKSDYLFNFKDNDVKKAKVSLHITNASIQAILAQVLANTDLDYAIDNRHITVFKSQKSEKTNNVKSKITGVIKDHLNEPLIGVSIKIKDQNIGTTTDTDGAFSIDVNENDVLIISYIGYTPQVIKVSKSTNLSIVLHEAIRDLDEVVIVGYGVQKKQTMTAAASTLKMNDITSTASTNLVSTLGGRVSGLLIQQTSGEAGYENPKIIIRGSSSPTSSDPLIVVDGIAGRSMAQIDPNEIENITVLKDASAVAPYGARGANGVILVTTRRGSSGRTSVNYSFKGGFGEPTRRPNIASSYDHARLMNEAWYNKEMDMGVDPGKYGVYTEDELQKFKDGSDLYAYPNTNWLKEVLLPRAWQQQHSLTISGGSDKVSYFLGFGYLDQDALYGDTRTDKPSTGFNRYNFRSNIDANVIDKWLTISVDVAYRQEGRNTMAESSSSVFHNMYRNPQTDPGRFPDGKLGKVSLGHNPIGLVTEGGWLKNRRSVLNTNFSAVLNIPGIDGLSVKGTLAYDKIFVKEKTWTTPVNYYVWNKILGEYDGSSPNREGSDLLESFSQDQSITAEFQANYNTKIGDDHQLGGLFVFSSTDSQGDSFWAARYKYQFSSLPQLFAGPDKDKDNSGLSTESAKLGTVFRLTYNYKERYMLEANGRIDGSERFPKAKRYGFFPSISAAWRISSEPFMEPYLDLVDNLKLRTSWGRAGTDNIGRFRYLSAYEKTGDAAIFGGQSPSEALAYSESRFPNEDITWETSEMFNIGVDVSFLGGKLIFEGDYFYKITRDILRARTDMPGILGYQIPSANVGTVDNRGVDFSLTHRNTIGDFTYSIASNFTWARNKIIDLLEPAGKKNNPRLRETGHSMSQYYGYEALGYFQSDEEADNSPQLQFGTSKAGDIQYKDQNGDGIIDAEDKTAIGRSNFPEIIYGINLSAAYKGFDVQLFFQGAGLVDFYYGGYLAHPYMEGRGGTLFEHHIDNTWTPENRNAEFPRLSYGNSPINSEFSSHWLRNGSYLRLKNIEIGYNFKKTLLKRSAFIQVLRLFISGQNLATWSGIKYFDPEMRSSSGTGYPQMKNYTLGASITF